MRSIGSVTRPPATPPKARIGPPVAPESGNGHRLDRPARLRDRTPHVGPAVQLVCLLAICLMLVGVALSEGVLVELAAVMALGTAAAAGYRTLLTWNGLLAFLIVVILFVPIRRYTVAGDLPFEVEPYRVLLAFVIGGWLCSLLMRDRNVRLRRSGADGAILMIAVGALGSVVANPARVSALSADVTKGLTFLASFLLLFYLIVSVVPGRAAIERLVKVLVGGGAALAALALIEARSGFNLFDHLDSAVPFLQTLELVEQPIRGARVRIYASAQHPIALGAALVMLVPLSIYLARRKPVWYVATALFVVAAISTISRTPVLMLMVVAIVFLILRPVQTRRLWPLLLPVLVVAHLAAPGALGTLRQAFLPEGGFGGLIAEQEADYGGTHGSGRVSDLGPALSEFAQTPIFGQGLSTRVIEEGRANAVILDDQWLGTLLETGLVGAIGWAWLFVRVSRRLNRAAREERAEDSDLGWLYVALSASIIAFGIGMFTLDAFAFIQLTFLQVILLGFGCALLREREGRPTRAIDQTPGTQTSERLPALVDS